MIHISTSTNAPQNQKVTSQKRQAKTGIARIITFVLTTTLTIYSAVSLAATDQTYVNRQFVNVTGTPANLNWSYSTLASTGHIMTVGNTATTGQGANVLLTRQATDGTVIWSVEYDGLDHLNDYGISMAEDADGNFIVAAASERAASGSMDILVLKFDTDGQVIWERIFSGEANGRDVPVSIAVDGNEIVVTGGTEATNGTSDMVTIRLDQDGEIMWVEQYDYSELSDVAVKVSVDPNTGNITVVGGSADQWNLYNMVTLIYDAGGNLTNEHRSEYQVGIDQPTGFGTDGNGNKVVGGYYIPAPGEMAMSLTSVDDTLGLNWTFTHDPNAGEDAITDMVVADDGRIFITGHVETEVGYFECYTAMVDQSGSIEWEERYQKPEGGAKGKSITLDAAGNVNVAAIVFEDGDTNLLTLQYNHQGRLLFSQVHEEGGSEIANGIMADPWGNIYVSATTTVNDNGYVTIKYNTFSRNLAIANDPSVTFDYIDNEMLIQFMPGLMDSNAINDQSKSFGQLSDFVDGSAINNLNELYDNQYDLGRWSTLKLFRRLTIDHEYSITRTGDTISVPPFWSTLIVIAPNTIDEIDMLLSLGEASDLIRKAEPNYVGTYNDIPNDPNFNNADQDGLESNHNPDVDIEMNRAWDVHHGTSNARVGVADSGIDWAHEDLSTTGSGTFNDSKVVDGWDYFHNVTISSDPDNDYRKHGTNTAGIIGAIRNNDLGVAGIAGGNADSNNFGCSLIGLKIGGISESNPFGTVLWSAVIEATMEGAMWSPGNNPEGFNLDVINYSIGFHQSAVFEDTASLLAEQVKFAYDNDCLIVAASGNSGDESVQFPASYHDHWVLKVGGSNASNGARFNSSTFGNELDIIAPAEPSLIMTLLNDHENYDETFGGTSAAAPHAAGAAALLVSNANDPAHWNLPNRLAPDDIEALLQIYRTEVNVVGYDAETGWGRLNAGEVMEHMEWPYFWVQHYNGETNSYSATQIASNSQVVLSQQFGNVSAGTYLMDVWEITITANHTLSAGESLQNGWMRHGTAHSNLFNQQEPIQPWSGGAKLSSVSATQAVMTGRIYRVNFTMLGQAVNEWIPFANGDPAKFGYSLHLNNPEATGIGPANGSQDNHLAYLYPNPVLKHHNIKMSKNDQISIDLFSMDGRFLRNAYEGPSADGQVIEQNVDDLAPGVYFYSIAGDRSTMTLKFVKR